MVCTICDGLNDRKHRQLFSTFKAIEFTLFYFGYLFCISLSKKKSNMIKPENFALQAIILKWILDRHFMM